MNKKLKALFGSAIRYAVASLSMAIFLYIIFALVFSTEEEVRLQRENRLYAERYKDMLAQEKLIGDVIDGLVDRDDAIYEELFESPAPSLDAITAADLIADSDSLSESFYLSSAATKSESLMKMAGNVDRNFDEVFRMLREKRDSVPPLSMPLKGISYAQTGASVGPKQNPVYKLELSHSGLDLIAPQGAPVYAAADGIVTKVINSRKGMGNVVEIDHRNGYITRYCLLGDVNAVRGRSVRRGQKIGTVGISSQVAAPHLHYEVMRDTLVMDPVNYLFASVNPEEYARMLYISVSTLQSMD
ncbi:MAG: M23 family metallopeptidase [Bacteroidales bacterium]|nr:M23 family metallopeptidase [Bacteroidales bacterium]